MPVGSSDGSRDVEARLGARVDDIVSACVKLYDPGTGMRGDVVLERCYSGVKV